MQVPLSTLRFIAFGGVLLTTACAYWFVPESRSRGHIFDEASRGAAQFGTDDGQRRLDIIIRREFPPETPVAELIQHIEGAGGDCSPKADDAVDPGLARILCTYDSVTYFPFAFFGMGEPSFHEGLNSWAVFISHSGGMIKGYEIDGITTMRQISREDYMEGVSRQRAEEELQQENAEE